MRPSILIPCSNSRFRLRIPHSKFRILDYCMHNIRLALRTLRATPIVSLVAILSLALGIGANTAIFSIIDSLVLRALPVRQPEQLVMLSEGSSNGLQSWTYPIWDQIRQRPEMFDGACA